MEWQFRKILESMDSYRPGCPKFIAEIDKGSPGAVKTIVREIQLIISDPNSNILSKVLAMRFAKDIMILGRQDIINQLTKLVPHMLKICSYRLESDDPNRGETFFYDHPQYKASRTAAEKQEIQKYGSTFFILTLESMYHWGNWIKQDQLGNQSMYSKGLNTLIERGVKFHSNFNYYKSSDTQKFKNTYKVEFFSQESSADYDSMSSHSQMYSANGRQNKRVNQSRDQSQQSLSRKGLDQGQTEYKSIGQIKNQVNSLYAQLQNPKNKEGINRRFDRIQVLKKSVISILLKKYPSDMVYFGQEKAEKKWLQDFVINYNLLSDHKISYHELLKRSSVQYIEVSKPDVQIYNRELQSIQNSRFKKSKSSSKRQQIISPQTILSKQPLANQKQKYQYQQSIKKQQQSYQDLKQKFNLQIRQLNKKLLQQRQAYQLQLSGLKQSYEDRIRNMKQQIAAGNTNKNEAIIKENERLKEKLYGLQRSLQVSRARQTQNQNRVTGYDTLKMQNQYLKKQKHDDQAYCSQKNNLIQKVKLLQRQLEISKNNNQILAGKATSEADQIRISKYMQNLADELGIYKTQLQNQRQENQKKCLSYQDKIQQLSLQLKSMKQKNKILQKKLDLRDIQAVELEEQVRLYKNLGSSEAHNSNNVKYITNQNQQLGIQKRYKIDQSNHKTESIGPGNQDQLNQNRFHNTNRNVVASTDGKMGKPVNYQPICYDFKKYENLRNNIFRNQKQLYLRFSRCCLKKKDLLMKQNGLEIGIISEVLSNNEVKFIIHLTNNTSQNQITQIKLLYQMRPSQYQVQLQNEYIFCLQPAEQEKVYLLCKCVDHFLNESYEPIYLILNYIKSGKNYQTKIIIPFLLFKLVQIYKVDTQVQINQNNQYTLNFGYSHKMLGEAKHLYSYFPPIQQTSSNVFQCDLLYRHTGSRFRLGVVFKKSNGSGSTNDRIGVILTPFGQSKASPAQQKLIQCDILGFLQFCFRK